ncbi:Arf family guanine nucleotide exchange factor SEC7 KNAG_0A04910 [Huiozyma naganishii CBS 8797]|uniref:SEC7 domain-containing protein n=1 Tax=Huiozyma naganishii (strain ATCC MYA-139 / BCRC 22969 / CBS 8797 / KCTC 17520 / NBRC 10181 / NCYC 3082 / Yp74L-3) TaxID=1071383 RepID=J7S2G2_HUIN7|nr:hypothetical protein KNAG_0A04910 [Kazachstania naganishii CBS 8797]CCK68159.1 hypothetical protein KNAG_0A04910 [Kazachstania naganishii CBS 8797]
MSQQSNISDDAAADESITSVNLQSESPTLQGEQVDETSDHSSIVEETSETAAQENIPEIQIAPMDNEAEDDADEGIDGDETVPVVQDTVTGEQQPLQDQPNDRGEDAVSQTNDDSVIHEQKAASHNLTMEQISIADSNKRSVDGVRTIASAAVSVPSTSVKATLSLVKNTLTTILEEKEVKKNPNTQKTIERTIARLEEDLNSESQLDVTADSILIFEALRDSCRLKSSKVQRSALDCLSKLFSFRALDESLLVNPPNSAATNDQNQEQDVATGITPPPKQKLIDAAIDTISSCFQGEGTSEKVELQIIRALSSCILVEDSISLCHGVSLLKAIRTIYNIFLFSLSASNQGIAQATLIQVVSSVFDKIDIKKNIILSNATTSPNEDSQTRVVPTAALSTDQSITLENMVQLNDDDERRVDAQQDTEDSEISDRAISSQELLIKDAFLVFRTMAKICSKPLDSELDMRSHAVRSKLLSLHIIYTIMKEHVDVLLSPNVILPEKEQRTLLNAIKQYLCLSLSRNAASPISPVFEITLEIMWLLMANLRAAFMREIPVFLTEIYFPITELKTSTNQQKRYFLNVIQRVCNDPRALIEFYLNYDCNPGMPNIMEMIVDYLTRLVLTRCVITPAERSYYEEQLSKPLFTFNFDQLPLLTTSNLSSSSNAQVVLPFPVEFALQMSALSCIVSVLRSLSSWAHRALNPNKTQVGKNNVDATESLASSSIHNETQTNSSLHIASTNADDETRSMLSQDLDNPTQFENLKQRKTQLSDCVVVFNTKPKKAIPLLVAKGFIADDLPQAIAKWLLATDGLDMAAIGDYLGEGDEKNIEIMHAFVDEFDFTGLSIVDALREFLQKFRLPGEGQKIDRFMLKFAERFVEQNPGIFSKADTAYVLSYSLIMLNTDLHSSQIKRKMTLEEFLENNEGIDNGNDLPKDFMIGLFNEIANNEIKLLSEQHQAMLQDDTAAPFNAQPQSAFNFFSSRDLEREAYMQVSKEIASKTELVFKNLSKSKEKSEPEVYYAASHVEHVKSIFETLWMSFLAALTPPFKDYADLDTSNKCLEGLKISIKIASIFGIEDARKSFLGALVQFCNLQNVEEIRVKNVNAMVDLLEVALAEGNYLKESWKDILLVISQIERLQLISKGIDRETVPDVSQARVANPRSSYDSIRTAQPYFFDIWSKRATPLELAQEKYHNQTLSPKMAKYISASELVVLMDNIFTKSSELSGNAIVDFIKALTSVSLEEIESSQYASTPRMFSLQKMIDVCYYNMDRIRLEWTPIWAVMGDAFNKITTNPNLAVVFFAVDSLRQLSMRFLDIEELSGFEFQHDFLKPFEYAIQNTDSVEVQEMIVECFRNFILVKANHIRSGWKPILESLSFTAQSSNEAIVSKTQMLLNEIIKTSFDGIFIQDNAFGQMVDVLKEISKNKKYQKLSLHALETLKSMVQYIAKISFSHNKDYNAENSERLLRGKDVFEDVWFPILYSFNDTIMTAEDLEVRSRALNYMFDALVAYGSEFDEAFWKKICDKLLFPIFDVLARHWEVNQFNSHDDLSVWLSTTLIQALRNLIALFTHYFESLSGMLDGFLALLVSCICQKNDTIARIGRSCFQQLILQNVNKFQDSHWGKISDVFETLFEMTTANELFDSDPLHQGRRKSGRASGNQTPTEPPLNETVQRAQREEGSEDVGNETSSIEATGVNELLPVNNAVAQRGFGSNEDLHEKVNTKNSIVIKCVLQLLLIELVSDLFEDEEFEHQIPYTDSVKLTHLLENSYEFARDFNDDFKLRTRLVEARVVDKIPNLLKQETSAAAVLIDITFKLYLNSDEKVPELLARLVNICGRIVASYNSLDERSMEKNILAWRPVIVEILQGYYEFDDEDFKNCCPSMYGLVICVLDKSVPTDLSFAIKRYLARVGELYLSVDIDE